MSVSALKTFRILCLGISLWGAADVARANPAATCADLLSVALGIDNLAIELPSKFSVKALLEKNADMAIYPDFRDEESIEGFIDANPFAGFITLGERLLFATRNPKVVRALTQPFDGPPAFAAGVELRQLAIEELPDYAVFDFSKALFMNDKIRALHGTFAWDEGPNCWNLCKMYKGWARTAYATSPEEFALWVDGPFSKPIVKPDSMFGIRPEAGQIIVVRKRALDSTKKSEVHGAIALGHGLVFTKNGYSHEAPYQVSTWEEMLKLYLPFLSNMVELREMRDFAEVWAEWRPKLNPELVRVYEAWQDFEAKHAALFIVTKQRQPDTPQSVYRQVDQLRAALRREFGPIIEKHQRKLRDVAEPGEPEKVEKFFWELLQLRVTSDFL